MKTFSLFSSTSLCCAVLLVCNASCTTNQNRKKKTVTAEPAPTAPVTVLPTSTGSKNSYNRVSVNGPYLALTFDDGPHPQNTPRLLDILKARNAKATFYVVGTNAKRYPDILRRIIAEGHEIGNHSTTHPSLSKLSDEGVRRELQICHDAVLSATGVAPRTMRPPYGAITTAQKGWIRQEFGYPSILWSVDPLDWKRPGSSVVSARLIAGANSGGILLSHDIHAGTIDAIPSVLDQLIAKGYQFVTVTQLLAMEQAQ